MKIFPIIFLLFSSIAFAQPQVKIGEDEKGIIRLKKDSFATYQEKEGKYISLTIEGVPNNTKKAAGQGHYKMLEKDCDNQGKFNVYRINDYDTEIISTHITKLNENNLHSVVASLMCDYNEAVKTNPEINKNSIQNLLRYAQFAPDNEWSIPMKMGEDKLLTLTDSIKFEEIYVSMIAKLQYPAKTTTYFKIYIDRDDCKAKKGIFKMKTLDNESLEVEDILFNLNIPPKNNKDLHFHNIAKTMCEYTMNNFQFKKRIDLSELNKPIETTGTMFDRATK